MDFVNKSIETRNRIVETEVPHKKETNTNQSVAHTYTDSGHGDGICVLLELDIGDLGDIMLGNLASVSSSKSMLPPFSHVLRCFNSNFSIFFDNAAVSIVVLCCCGGWSSSLFITFGLFIWNSLELWLIALYCNVGRLLSHISPLGSMFTFETIFYSKWKRLFVYRVSYALTICKCRIIIIFFFPSHSSLLSSSFSLSHSLALSLTNNALFCLSFHHTEW